MNTPVRHLYTLACILLISLFAISLYGVTVAIAWSRDLPNRIVIDEAAVTSFTSTFITESYRHVLRDGDAETQSDVLRNQLIPYAQSDTAAAEWLHSEYGDDIRRLAILDDPAVSSPASDLMSLLELQTEIDAPEDVR